MVRALSTTLNVTLQEYYLLHTSMMQEIQREDLFLAEQGVLRAIIQSLRTSMDSTFCTNNDGH